MSAPQSQPDFNVYFQLLMDQYLGRNGLKKGLIVGGGLMSLGCRWPSCFLFQFFPVFQNFQ